ncbi:MAG: hypothetical protein HN837_09810 [Chloroflexi bacterium]|jgi:CHASE3 domain sensor protein|nr:hypothetical protein [Chloroflexota bacterium]MBT7290767.1 hypothetical protein [Chloroflexota bacterium]
MSISMNKMKIKTKLITSFSLIIILNLVLAIVLYFSFSTVKNNVREIEQQFTPAANSVRDLANALETMRGAIQFLKQHS